MKIAVIGAGSVGSGIGTAWAKAGHDVIFGVRKPDDPDIKELLAQSGATAAALDDAAAQAQIVLLALPWQVAETALKGLGDLSGKIVIDAMNPLAMDETGLHLDRGFTSSGGETVAQWLSGASVVKTLNQTGANIMADTSGLSARPAMFLAGDDEEAKQTVAGLVEVLGFEAMDAGTLSIARLLEPLAMVWINQSLMRDKGRDWAFAAISKQ